MRTRVHENPLTGTLTIEADSPAEALEEAATRLGSNAHIEVAQRVSRGGVAGFFAKERFQVRARAEYPETAQSSSPWGDEDPPFDIEQTPLFEAVEQVLNEAAERQAAEPATETETDFGSALQAALYAAVEHDTIDLTELSRVDDVEIEARVAREDQIRAAAAAAATSKPDATAGLSTTPTVTVERAPEPVVADAPPPPPPPPPPVSESPVPPAVAKGAPSWRLRGPADPVAPGLGRVDWGKASLVRLGLPTTLIDAVADIDVRDDLGWVSTIADVVAPLCRALPPGPAVMVGSGVERVASTLGLALVRPGDEVIPEGSFCTDVGDDPAEIEWLMRTRGNRNLHLVIGNDPWMHLLVDDPASVSYVGDSGVVDALYVALTLGAPLGYGTIDGSRKLSRIDAVDVALTVRRLVGRR